MEKWVQIPSRLFFLAFYLPIFCVCCWWPSSQPLTTSVTGTHTYMYDIYNKTTSTRPRVGRQSVMEGGANVGGVNNDVSEGGVTGCHRSFRGQQRGGGGAAAAVDNS